MGTLGEMLREARERKGASLADIERYTRIRKKHLQALEEGDYPRLPPQVYVRGFLRSLASYLELDLDDLLARYAEETAGQEAAPPPIRLTSEPLMPAPMRLLNWLAGVGILAIIAVVAYWTYQQQLWKPLLPLIVPRPTETVALSDATPTPQVALSLRPTATETAVDTATPTSTVQPATASPSPTVAPSTPSPSPTPSASATPVPTRTPNPTSTPQPPTATVTLPTSPTAFPQLLLIRLEITERAWVRVVIDQEEVFQGILETGAFRTWVARREATIRTGNAGGTWLRINDGPRELMGGRGQVVQSTWLMQSDGTVVTATPITTPTATATPGAEG